MRTCAGDGRAASRAVRVALCAALCALTAVATRAARAEGPERPAERAATGTLVIVGGGRFPGEARAAFIAAAGGPEAARLVVIPTATLDADDPEEESSFLAPWRAAGVREVRLLHTRDLKRARESAFFEPLAAATGVWISGGDQTRLVDAYAETPVPGLLRAVLARGGVVGGTSAGAAILSDTMIVGGREEPELGRGFALLPGTVVDQHVLQRDRVPRLTAAIARTPGHVGLGVDEDTAVILEGVAGSRAAVRATPLTGRVVGASAAVVVESAAGSAPTVRHVAAGQPLTLPRAEPSSSPR